MKRIASILFLSLILCGGSYATTVDQMVTQYIDRSGLREMVANMPAQIRQMGKQRQAASKNPAQEQKITDIMLDIYDESAVLDTIHQYLLRHTDRDYLGKMLSWYDTALAKKVKAEEVLSSSPEGLRGMQPYILQIQRTPPPRTRIDLIQQLETVTRLSDLMTSISVDTIRVMVESDNLMRPEAEREPDEKIDQVIVNLRPVLKENLRRQVILMSFYTYRNISDDELKEYIRFYQTPLGQQEVEITSNAIRHFLAEWFGEVAYTVNEQLIKERAMKSSPALGI